MPDINTKTFVFNNHADGLYPLVTDMIAYIHQHTKVSEATTARLKMTMVELLTNALKHANQTTTAIKVELKGDKVSIQKKDTGNGMAILCGENLLEWLLPGMHHAGKIITIYSNGDATLKATLKDNCTLQFFIEETENTDPVDINTLAEHFGLMIITRACDTFTYHFDIDTCSNNFIVSIAL
nr:ATP-binding protein [Mucilaginibacter sp. L294]